MRAVLKQEGCSAPVPAPAENQESRPNIPESVGVEPAHPVQPGDTITWTRADGTTQIGGPTTPLHPGWQLTWRDHTGTLQGGWDDPAHGTIATCEWTGSTWRVILTDGVEVPLSRIVGVRKMRAGECVGAWNTREHGLNGEGSR